jgi:hypothetical protein
MAVAGRRRRRKKCLYSVDGRHEGAQCGVVWAVTDLKELNHRACFLGGEGRWVEPRLRARRWRQREREALEVAAAAICPPRCSAEGLCFTSAIYLRCCFGYYSSRYVVSGTVNLR